MKGGDASAVVSTTPKPRRGSGHTVYEKYLNIKNNTLPSEDGGTTNPVQISNYTDARELEAGEVVSTEEIGINGSSSNSVSAADRLDGEREPEVEPQAVSMHEKTEADTPLPEASAPCRANTQLTAVDTFCTSADPMVDHPAVPLSPSAIAFEYARAPALSNPSSPSHSSPPHEQYAAMRVSAPSRALDDGRSIIPTGMNRSRSRSEGRNGNGRDRSRSPNRFPPGNGHFDAPPHGDFNRRPISPPRGRFNGRPSSPPRGGFNGRPCSPPGGFNGRPGSPRNFNRRPGSPPRGNFNGRPGSPLRCGLNGRPCSPPRGGFNGRPGSPSRGGFNGRPGSPPRGDFNGRPGSPPRGGFNGRPGSPHNNDFGGRRSPRRDGFNCPPDNFRGRSPPRDDFRRGPPMGPGGKSPPRDSHGPGGPHGTRSSSPLRGPLPSPPHNGNGGPPGRGPGPGSPGRMGMVGPRSPRRHGFGGGRSPGGPPPPMGRPMSPRRSGDFGPPRFDGRGPPTNGCGPSPGRDGPPHMFPPRGRSRSPDRPPPPEMMRKRDRSWERNGPPLAMMDRPHRGPMPDSPPMMEARPFDTPSEWNFELRRSGKVKCRCSAISFSVGIKHQLPLYLNVVTLPHLNKSPEFLQLERPHVRRVVYELRPESMADARGYQGFVEYLIQGRGGHARAGGATEMEPQGFKIFLLPPGQAARQLGYKGDHMIAVLRSR